jgi:hypothetical protein
VTNLRRYQVFALEWYGELKAAFNAEKRKGNVLCINDAGQQLDAFKDNLKRLGLMDEEDHMSKDLALIVHKSFVKRSIEIENIEKRGKDNV